MTVSPKTGRPWKEILVGNFLLQWAILQGVKVTHLPSESRRHCRGRLFSTTEQRDYQVEVHLVITAVAKTLGFPLPPFIFICSSRSSGSHLEDDAIIKVVKKAAFARTVAALDFGTRSPQSKLS
jgi:hypothetical protein